MLKVLYLETTLSLAPIRATGPRGLSFCHSTCKLDNSEFLLDNGIMAPLLHFRDMSRHGGHPTWPLAGSALSRRAGGGSFLAGGPRGSAGAVGFWEWPLSQAAPSVLIGSGGMTNGVLCQAPGSMLAPCWLHVGYHSLGSHITLSSFL